MEHNNDMKKMLLHKLVKFRMDGHQLTQTYDMNSDFEELQYEVDRIEDLIRKEDELSLLGGLIGLSESFKEHMNKEKRAIL